MNIEQCIHTPTNWFSTNKMNADIDALAVVAEQKCPDCALLLVLPTISRARTDTIRAHKMRIMRGDSPSSTRSSSTSTVYSAHAQQQHKNATQFNVM